MTTSSYILIIFYAMSQDTVLIKHLPSALSQQDKIELLRHFGATEVNIVGSSNNQNNLVFAKFENNTAAEIAIKKLHNLNILDHRISAEISKNSTSDGLLNINDRPRDYDGKQYNLEKAKSVFLEKLGFSINNYDFNKPPALNIYYQYPPPTKDVLENICKAMANVPNLYYQVLHLMNKMNLPCPFFDNYTEESGLFKNDVSCNTIDYKDQNKETPEKISTSESEIGSDGEYPSQEIIPTKRKKISKNMHIRPKFVKPQVVSNQTSKTSLKPGDVFENAHKEKNTKKIELKITPNLSSIQEAQGLQNVESKKGFDKIKTLEKKQESMISIENKSEEDKNVYPLISREELAANKVSQNDQRILSAFKNYQAGAPSCRLYIKNLSKNVVTKDLHFIFRRYFRPELDEVQGSMFDIRLMQEGKMKGQAFITLQSIELARTALNETNGYILKDKPMVVQFARSANTTKK